jgi:hypothetical protein
MLFFVPGTQNSKDCSSMIFEPCCETALAGVRSFAHTACYNSGHVLLEIDRKRWLRWGLAARIFFLYLVSGRLLPLPSANDLQG